MKEDMYGRFPKYCQIVRYGHIYAIEQAINEFNLKNKIINIQDEFNWVENNFLKIIDRNLKECTHGIEPIKISTRPSLKLLEEMIQDLNKVNK